MSSFIYITYKFSIKCCKFIVFEIKNVQPISHRLPQSQRLRLFSLTHLITLRLPATLEKCLINLTWTVESGQSEIVVGQDEAEAEAEEVEVGAKEALKL